jgi:tetratricopeptide (TPR) repeat protein
VTSAPLSSAELEVIRIRELSRARLYGEALTAAESLAVALPTQRDILYLIATNQRCLQRIPQALETLERLEKHHPNFALLYQERGYCLAALREAARAIETFQTAISLNPLLLASWSMLQRLHHMVGHAREAAVATEHVSALNQLTDAVKLRVSTLAHQRDVPEEAERLLAEILELTPEYHAARLEYVRVLIERQKYLQAREAIGALATAGSAARSLSAAICVGLGEYEQAISLYSQLLADDPERAELRLPLAHCLKAAGHQQAAIEAYQTATQTPSGYADACWSLANLKTYRFSPNELARMQNAAAARSTRPIDRYSLCFALGKAFEDLGEYARSWEWYERGNELRHARNTHHPEHLETNTRRLMELTGPEFFAARNGWGTPEADPIFIVGLPRSGSTLIEQILASHSKVEGTLELPVIPRMVSELPRYPAMLAELTAKDVLRLGARYIESSGIYRHSRRPHFIDKMPNNFRHVGLIHLLVPNARIIDARREPLACCVSNFKQLFAGGQDFTYSLEDLGRYYRTYLELMAHWDRALPGRVLRVQYQDLVVDLEGSVRRLLQFCGLELEPACLEFHRTRRNIGTPSSEQVRQPIFRSGLDQWYHYEPWLGPLKDALGDALVRYRY